VTVKRWTGVRAFGFSAASAFVLTCATLASASGGQQAAEATKAQPKAAATATTPAKKSTSHATSSHVTAKSRTKSGTRKAGATHTASSHTSPTKGSRRKKTARTRGQQKIDSERAQSIQEALIREHYLNGEATGAWNQASEDAMRRYQSDHGWQSKTVPDARALIKLGLGPSHDHLLNPESAMTTGPDAPSSASLSPTSHSADPGAVMNRPANTQPLPATTPEPIDSSGPQ
jgi:hypothetical protein